MNIDDAEEIRTRTGLTPYEFSRRLGYSYSTYYSAKKRGSLSRGLAFAIAVRFRKTLAKVRQGVAA